MFPRTPGAAAVLAVDCYLRAAHGTRGRCTPPPVVSSTSSLFTGRGAWTGPFLWLSSRPHSCYHGEKLNSNQGYILLNSILVQTMTAFSPTRSCKWSNSVRVVCSGSRACNVPEAESLKPRLGSSSKACSGLTRAHLTFARCCY